MITSLLVLHVNLSEVLNLIILCIVLRHYTSLYNFLVPHGSAECFVIVALLFFAQSRWLLKQLHTSFHLSILEGVRPPQPLISALLISSLSACFTLSQLSSANRSAIWHCCSFHQRQECPSGFKPSCSKNNLIKVQSTCSYINTKLNKTQLQRFWAKMKCDIPVCMKISKKTVVFQW